MPEEMMWLQWRACLRGCGVWRTGGWQRVAAPFCGFEVAMSAFQKVVRKQTELTIDGNRAVEFI